MTKSRIQDIKRGQKESLLFKEISELFMKTALDDPKLAGLSINRVSLSPDKSFCTVYFYSAKGKADFEEKLELLKLYKPSMRKAIAKTIKGRYVPDLKFAFDEQFEKQQKVEELFEKLKREGQL
jgi:ribosome-binding factor A